ncbi:hypothetical protein [Rhodopirellula baltica]
MVRSWPQDWQPITDPEHCMEWGRIAVDVFDNEPIADTLEAELDRELCREHPLHGIAVTAVGYMQKCPNDFLYSLDDGTGRFAWVHLTWETEDSPKFPFTQIYPDWAAFVRDAPKVG